MGGRRTRVRTRVRELGTRVCTRVPQGGTRTWTRLEISCTRTRLVLGKGCTRSISERSLFVANYISTLQVAVTVRDSELYLFSRGWY